MPGLQAGFATNAVPSELTKGQIRFQDITLNSDHNMCSCCILCILYVIGISNGVALGHCKSSRACRPLAFQIASHCLLGRIAVWHCVERGWNVWHCSLALQFDEDDVYDDLGVLALKDWRAWNVDMLKRQNG